MENPKPESHCETTANNDNQAKIQNNLKELLSRYTDTKTGSRAFSTCKKAGEKRERIL